MAFLRHESTEPWHTAPSIYCNFFKPVTRLFVASMFGWSYMELYCKDGAIWSCIPHQALKTMANSGKQASYSCQTIINMQVWMMCLDEVMFWADCPINSGLSRVSLSLPFLDRPFQAESDRPSDLPSLPSLWGSLRDGPPFASKSALASVSRSTTSRRPASEAKCNGVKPQRCKRMRIHADHGQQTSIFFLPF